MTSPMKNIVSDPPPSGDWILALIADTAKGQEYWCLAMYLPKDGPHSIPNMPSYLEVCATMPGCYRSMMMLVYVHENMWWIPRPQPPQAFFDLEMH